MMCLSRLGYISAHLHKDVRLPGGSITEQVSRVYRTVRTYSNSVHTELQDVVCGENTFFAADSGIVPAFVVNRHGLFYWPKNVRNRPNLITVQVSTSSEMLRW